MNNPSQYAELESELNSFYAAIPVRDEFVRALNTQLDQSASGLVANKQRHFSPRPGWVAAIVVLLMLVISFFAIGPQRVYAIMQRLLGYIPGVGVVDTSAPIRVLKEPVTQSRDGISITVTAAVLTADRTHLEVQIFGVPRSAYPNSESISGCIDPPYLLLPDGSKLQASGEFPALPAQINTATLVIPCITNTLPGSVPDNWNLPLQFIAAPADMTVMPVEELQPSATDTLQPPQATPSESETGTIATPSASVTVTQVIDTDTGYILVVAYAPAPGAWVQRTGMVTITDATGKDVPYSIPVDVLNSIEGQDPYTDWMAYKFSAIGVTFPITFHYPGVTVSSPGPTDSTTILFDAGEDPQPGQEWQLNQKVQLSGHEITLVSVSADSRGGYDFHFKTDDAHVSGVGLSIEGHTPNGGGGGGGGALTNGEFTVSQAFETLPTGKLTLLLSGIVMVSDPYEWTTTWSPDQPRTDLSTTPSFPAGTCGDANTVTGFPALSGELSGKVLTYGQLQNSDQWGLELYNLDGSGKILVASDASWGALSTDGSKVVYSGQNGLSLYDFGSGTTTALNVKGYAPFWSRDGKQFAYTDDTASGIYVYDLETQTGWKISAAAYSPVIGWSTDDTKLYIAIMAAGGSAWQMQSVDLKEGTATPLFIIEDGSYKALNATLSPDGQWIAYRGRDNSSIYLVKIDGSSKHLLLDAPAAATSGLAWASNDWLAVSLIENAEDEQKLILVNPATCSGYFLPALRGSLQAIQVQ